MRQDKDNEDLADAGVKPLYPRHIIYLHNLQGTSGLGDFMVRTVSSQLIFPKTIQSILKTIYRRCSDNIFWKSIPQ